MAPRELIHAVALPLMRMVGDRWHEEQLRIAQEHLVTQLMSSLLGGMLRIYAPQDPPAVIMTATLSDDLHEFGILAAAILAAGSGLGVIHLGANLPAREISYALKRSKADVVLISITNFVGPNAERRTVTSGVFEYCESCRSMGRAESTDYRSPFERNPCVA